MGDLKMPFDDRPSDHGGGGGPEDPGHNPAVMRAIIKSAEIQLLMNVQFHGVCHLCTCVNLMESIVRNILTAAKVAEEHGHGDAAENGRRALAEFAERLDNLIIEGDEG
jgi:hypothetical protein